MKFEPLVYDVVRVRMALGTANGIGHMRWTKTSGWIATDITGSEYRQHHVRGRPRNKFTNPSFPKGLIILLPDNTRKRLPWPPPPDAQAAVENVKE